MLQVDSVIDAVVTQVAVFGIYLSSGGHAISDTAHQPGDVVRVRVESIDEATEKIELSEIAAQSGGASR